MAKPFMRSFSMKIFLIALLIRCVVIFLFQNPPISTDFLKDYDIIAKNIVQEKSFSIEANNPVSHRLPLYPFYLALIYFIFGHSLILLKIFNSVLSGITCVLIYSIGKKAFGEAISKIACLLLAFYPPFIWQDMMLTSEPLFISLFIGSVFLIYYLKKPFLGGIILGLAILTRPIPILLPVFVALLVSLFLKANFKMSMRNVFVTYIGIILIISPWTIRNYITQGGFILVSNYGGGASFYLGTTDHQIPPLVKNDRVQKDLESVPGFKEASALTVDRILYTAGIKNILKNPTKSLMIFGLKPLLFWYATDSGRYDIFIIFMQLFYLIPCIIGIFSSLKNPSYDKQKLLILMSIILYFLVFHTIAFSGVRYSMPIMPFIILFAGYSWYAWYIKFKKINVCISRWEFLEKTK